MQDITTIEKTVEKFIELNDLLDKQRKLAIALSGGADSVCLLLLLTKLGYQCDAIHCNFHLRGKESMRDEAFVTDLCQRMGIRLFKRDFQTGIFASKMGISIEIAAREQRYTYFREVLDETGDQAIATAHHRDDNVETLMLNLGRGTGIRGMRGIPPKNGRVVRPFLCISRSDILFYLERHGQDFVEDSSNREDVFSRNKIRLDVVPVLNSINLSASANIAQSMDNMREVCKIYEDAMQKAIAECSTKEQDVVKVNINAMLHQVSPRSVLHEIIYPLGFNHAQEISIFASLREVGKIFTTPKQRLLIDRTEIIIEPMRLKADEMERTIDISGDEGEFEVRDLGLIKYRIVYIEDVKINTDRHHAYLDYDKLTLPLKLRTVKNGDSFAPFGLKGDLKLVSDFLTERKLNRFQKEHQKVLVSGDDIAWIVGERISEHYKVDEEETTKVLELSVE